MRRFTRRALAVTAGLALGWLAAGMVPAGLPGPQATLAQEAAVEPAARAPAVAQDHAHENPAVALVPTEDTSWYRWVLVGSAGLFVAAVVVGLAYRWLGIPTVPGPDPAAHAGHGHEHAEEGQLDEAHPGRQEPVPPGSHAGTQHKPHAH